MPLEIFKTIINICQLKITFQNWSEKEKRMENEMEQKTQELGENSKNV
jgi:hypothetical protein